MRKLLLLLSFFHVICSNGQTDDKSSDNLTNVTTQENIYYPNPYRNHLLSDYYDPSQTDFSKDFLFLQTKHIEENALNISKEVESYDFDASTLFATGEFEQNGVLGVSNERISIHISKVAKTVGDSIIFHVEGKSKHGDNIIHTFRGEIKVISIYKYMSDRLYPGQGVLFANYEFYQDKDESDTGIFKGVFEATIRIDQKNKSIRLDERLSPGFLYNNRTYVGTWTSYKGEPAEKCIWGDYRLPFTFDFDCGDKVMMACDKYIKNGWETFSDGSEYDCTVKPCRLKNQWWK